MNPINIARVAHEVNRAYCASIGDHSQPSWDAAPDWQRESAINGVVFAMTNPEATPADSHANWLKEKLADGWVFGETKDPAKKTHPCCVEYEFLPQAQRTKDYLFQAVVRSLAASHDNKAAAA